MSYRLRNVLLAIALVAVGVVLSTSYVSSRARTAEEGQKLVEVLVAKRPIPEGTSARELASGGFVEVRKVRAGDAVPGAVSSVGALEDRAAVGRLFTGDQISSAKFSTEADLDPSARIGGTQRWVALPIGKVQAVGAGLQVADRVDVFATRVDGANVRTILIARDLEVVQVPKAAETSSGGISRSNAGSDDGNAYTFVASDRLADQLIWASNWQNTGGLHLALRPGSSATDSSIPRQRTTFGGGTDD